MGTSDDNKRAGNAATTGIPASTRADYRGNFGLEELVRVKHRRAYAQEPPPRPDWRIQCVYVDPRHRGQGIARMALQGALEQIAQRGGGRVEAISEVTAGRQAPGRFLFSATVELFEQNGFTRGRKLGKHAYIVTRRLLPAQAG